MVGNNDQIYSAQWNYLLLYKIIFKLEFSVLNMSKFKQMLFKKKKNQGIINCYMLGKGSLFLNFEFHLR